MTNLWWAGKRGSYAGQADAGQFGIFDMKGLWFVRENLVRDVAALNQVELLPGMDGGSLKSGMKK